MRKTLKSSLEKQWSLEVKRKENISNIAHDLKTPLTIISTYSEALLNKDLDYEMKHSYIERIYENNKRAINVISNMNKLINIENPNYTINPIEIDTSSIKSSIGYYDVDSINQVLDNIVFNSIRYASNKKIDIKVLIFILLNSINIL